MRLVTLFVECVIIIGLSQNRSAISPAVYYGYIRRRTATKNTVNMKLVMKITFLHKPKNKRSRLVFQPDTLISAITAVNRTPDSLIKSQVLYQRLGHAYPARLWWAKCIDSIGSGFAVADAAAKMLSKCLDIIPRKMRFVKLFAICKSLENYPQSYTRVIHFMPWIYLPKVVRRLRGHRFSENVHYVVKSRIGNTGAVRVVTPTNASSFLRTQLVLLCAADFGCVGCRGFACLFFLHPLFHRARR